MTAKKKTDHDDSAERLRKRASEELTAAIKTVTAGGLYLSPGIAGLGGRRPS